MPHYLRRDVLWGREALVGIDPDALRVLDEHVEHLVLIANGFDVVGQRLWARRTDNIQFGPEFLAGRAGTALLVGPADDRG